ncbi:hypothetical protein [Lacrimispora amygdalina]|nr:hypothetical protein [Clostridium indicum]
MGYDEIIKTVNLTDDEITLLKEILEVRQDKCISVGEVMTIETLLEKLD